MLKYSKYGCGQSTRKQLPDSYDNEQDVKASFICTDYGITLGT